MDWGRNSFLGVTIVGAAAVIREPCMPVGELTMVVSVSKPQFVVLEDQKAYLDEFASAMREQTPPTLVLSREDLERGAPPPDARAIRLIRAGRDVFGSLAVGPTRDARAPRPGAVGGAPRGRTRSQRRSTGPLYPRL